MLIQVQVQVQVKVQIQVQVQVQVQVDYFERPNAESVQSINVSRFFDVQKISLRLWWDLSFPVH